MTRYPKCPKCDIVLDPDYSEIEESLMWMCHNCSRAYYTHETLDFDAVII